jgi:hypothetical protein
MQLCNELAQSLRLHARIPHLQAFQLVAQVGVPLAQVDDVVVGQEDELVHHTQLLVVADVDVHQQDVLLLAELAQQVQQTVVLHVHLEPLSLRRQLVDLPRLYQLLQLNQAGQEVQDVGVFSRDAIAQFSHYLLKAFRVFTYHLPGIAIAEALRWDVGRGLNLMQDHIAKEDVLD